MQNLLEVDRLSVDFKGDLGHLRAVDDISFSIREGETLGLVGESGCGKSVTALSIMRLLPYPAGAISHGSIRFEGQAIHDVPLAQMEKIRGEQIGMVFQEPLTALNPVHTIGKQVCETLLVHRRISESEALKQARDILDRVGIPSAELRLGEYPHQLSGGMRQRVVIAMALICNPKLLIADEPTTALDVTIQAQILDLIAELQQSMGMSVLLITHDLGIIAGQCDRVLVMYAGKIVEAGSVFDIFDRPSHPYTRGLLDSIPRLEKQPKTRLSTIEGQVPSLDAMPAGCRFENRCDHAEAACREVYPACETIEAQHQVYCRRWRDIQTSDGGANG